MTRSRLSNGWRGALAGVVVTLAAMPAAVSAQAPPAGWQRTDLRPVTQPVAADGLLVMYASQGGGLRVVAVDPGTGRTVWAQLASPSDITPGETPSLLVRGDTVVYLARNLEDSATLTAADAHTGVTRWESLPALFSTWPGACPDAPSAICISGSDLLSLRGGELRFDAATGRPLPFAHIREDGARTIGPGLVDPGDRNPERLVSVRGARIAWSRPLARIFPGASTDFGWIIDRFNALELFVGSIGPGIVRRGSREVPDLSRECTAGFRIADGHVAWRTRGSHSCRTILPCPGQSQSGGTPGPSVPTVGLRTVSTGTFSGRAGSNADLVPSRDATARVEGFSPATGRTRWRFDAGHSLALLNAAAPLPQIALNTVVLRDAPAPPAGPRSRDGRAAGDPRDDGGVVPEPDHLPPDARLRHRRWDDPRLQRAERAVRLHGGHAAAPRDARRRAGVRERDRRARRASPLGPTAGGCSPARSPGSGGAQPDSASMSSSRDIDERPGTFSFCARS